MFAPRRVVLLAAVLFALARVGLPQAGAPKAAAPAPAALTNQDVIKMAQAKFSDDVIVNKIRTSTTKFDTSLDAMIALRSAGVSDRVISVMVNPAAPSRSATSATSSGNGAPASSSGNAGGNTGGNKAAPAASNSGTGNSGTGLKPGYTASNASRDAAPTVTAAANRPQPRPRDPGQAPENYGVYIQLNGELKPLGRVQSKVQLSKFRTLVRNWVPFMREKIDINVPGAHSTSRFETYRPNFYAYFPPSRDASKFKMLQAKITGEKYDQRTIANASILFSTEQNQDEVPTDIGPTNVKDLYRISPREDLPSGEFGFVEGKSGSNSTSNIEIIDVYDFGIDRKEDKLPLQDYLATITVKNLPAPAFLDWSKEDCVKIVNDREGKLGLTGSLMGPFKRQFASLDVYWADDKFAQAFARLEQLDKQLKPDQARKLAALLMGGPDQYYVVVSIGSKIGSGHVIGANEGERLMRPFDAVLTAAKGKDIVPATKLEFIGGYAGLWKITFDQKSVRGPLFDAGKEGIVFEARLNQNLDFKADFPTDIIGAKQ